MDSAREEEERISSPMETVICEGGLVSVEDMDWRGMGWGCLGRGRLEG